MTDQPIKTAASTGSPPPKPGEAKSQSGASPTGGATQKLQGGSQSGKGQSAESSSAQGFAEKAAAAGRELKSKAADLAGSSSEAIKSQAADLVDAAKGAASDASERLQREADTRKSAGAEYVGNLANTLRRAAREFESELPIAATYIRKAASQVEDVSDTIQNGSFSDLVRGAQSFARRQPTAFLGLAVLAGFGAIRFLKSSASGDDHAPSSQNSFGNDNGTVSRPGINRYASNSDNQGYRDEFTK